MGVKMCLYVTHNTSSCMTVERRSPFRLSPSTVERRSPFRLSPRLSRGREGAGSTQTRGCWMDPAGAGSRCIGPWGCGNQLAIHPTPEWDVVTPLDNSRELYNTQKTRFGGGLRPRRGTFSIQYSFGRRIRENLHFRPGNPLRKFHVATPRSDSRTHSLPIVHILSVFSIQ